MKNNDPLAEFRSDPRTILVSAWIVLMLLYIYCDIFSLFRPGQLGSMMEGKMGFFAVTQIGLLLASLLMIIPSMMIIFTAAAPAKVARPANLAAGALYLLVNVGNVAGETWGYYFLFAGLEMGLTVFIFVAALRWPRGSEGAR